MTIQGSERERFIWYGGVLYDEPGTGKVKVSMVWSRFV